MFVDYSYFLRPPTNSSLSGSEAEKNKLRFDARMLYHFDQVLAINPESLKTLNILAAKAALKKEMGTIKSI